MSLTSSRLSLIYRCSIVRDANAGTDDGSGNPQPSNFQPHLSDLPCRFWAEAGREAVDDTTTVVIEDLRLLVPSGSDITEDDQVELVTYRGGTVLDGPAGIRAMLTRQSHIELVLVRVT